MNVTKGDTSELKQAIAFYGPVSILINTQPKSFKFYGSGIYYDPECSKYTNISFPQWDIPAGLDICFDEFN